VIPPGWNQSKDGQLIVRAFAAAPYPHASRENGYKTKDKTFPRDPHYVDSAVAVFIPAGYQPGKTVDYVVHFHGHKMHLSKVLTNYDLLHQMQRAKVNAILIVPQGAKDAPDEGFGKLELDNGGLRRLLEEVTAFLQAEGKVNTSTIGKVVITAHSGGYNGAGAVLDHGGLGENITDCVLFDATYGWREQFAKWAQASPEHRLVSFYTEHLAERNKQMMGMLTKSNTAFVQLNEADLNEAELHARGAKFIETKLAHDEVVSKRNYFSLLLSTSALTRATGAPGPAAAAKR